MRVLPPEDRSPAMEYSIEGYGSLIGVEVRRVTTFNSVAVGGIFLGEGRGVLLASNGDLVTWAGQGIGIPSGPGGASSWRGSRFFQTTS